MAQCMVVRGADRGFGGEQVRRTYLHGAGAQSEGGGDPARVSDAAGGDHRHADSVDDLRHQRHQADLAIEVVAEKHAAVAAGFNAHGDDRVAAMLLQPNRLFDGCGRRKYLGAGRFDAVEQGLFRQAKMETDHLRAKCFDDLAGVFVERCTVGYWRRRIKVGAQFAVVGLQQVLPAPIMRFVRFGRLVAEEIHIDWPRAGLADSGQSLAQLLDTQRRCRHRAKRAGLVGGDDHLRSGRTGHGRLDDRHIDAQQVENARVWPGAHGMRLQR